MSRPVTKNSVLRILLAVPQAFAHMEMSWPYPFRSKYNPANDYSDIDYSMTSPLLADGSNFPCKGHQNDQDVSPTVTYTAGSTYNMTLSGSATHGGGSCQLSLSYDNGATFRVIKSMIGGCPLTSTYDFTIPSYAPDSDALLAWTWQNLEGNREYYMNCAPISIVAASTRRQKRSAYRNVTSLPYIWKANLEGVNDCETVEDTNVVYPSPGPDVIYGGGPDYTSTFTAGDCDEPTPYGQTYEARDSATDGDAIVSAAASSDSSPTSLPTTITTTRAAASSLAEGNSSTVMFQTLSTTTVTVACDPTVTITLASSPPPVTTFTVTGNPAVYTTSVPSDACSATTADCPCNQGYQCQALGDCAWQCQAAATTITATLSITPSTSTSSVMIVTSSASITSSSRSSSASTQSSISSTSSSQSSTSGTPSYATSEDLNSDYLPCVPGTFICSSASTWYTCDYDSTGAYVYGYPRDVSAGTQCFPQYSPYSSSTSQYAQQGSTPSGYYRDDRIAAAQPEGSCTDDGAIQCTNGGSSFDVCNQGGWVEMGSVAAGTTCENGQIVASS